MPIARIGSQTIYFAHIPKCAGSSVEDYLRDRFGPLALLDRRYLAQEPVRRWTQSSPQHVDWQALMRLFPADYFDAIFTVVRHPLSRALSAYRFQAKVEGSIPPGMGFGDWLEQEAEARDTNPYRSDNHSRPQVDFLPRTDGPHCAVFHLEHGLDALIPWFDTVEGVARGPRAMQHTNAANAAGDRTRPTPEEIALVAQIYAADFARFGYAPDQPAPLAPAPELSAAFIAANQRARTPIRRLATKLRHRARKWLG